MLSRAKVMKLSQSSANLKLMVTKKMAIMAPVLLYLHRRISALRKSRVGIRMVMIPRMISMKTNL